MPSTTYPTNAANEYPEEPTIDPLAPLEQLAHWLLSTTIHLALGLLLGYLIARAMRRRHLHWSWAALALPIVLEAQGLLGSLTWTLAAGALAASAQGRRWHREDLQAGADLAEIARERRGPLEALRALVGAALSRLRTDGDPLWTNVGDTDELAVGCDGAGRQVTIPLGGTRGGTHTLVVGAAGSGKTVTQTWIATRAIERGMAAVVIDPKDDRGMRDALAQAARARGASFIEWTPEGESVYNPYSHGGETEIADRLLAGERFTEPHYLRQAQRYLGHEIRTLRRAGLRVSLAQVVRHLDPERLELLARSLPELEAREVHEYLDSLTPRQRGDLTGVRDRLAIVVESDVGRWIDPSTPGARSFDLLGAVRGRAVVYFSLRSDSRPLLAQMLGSAIVQDLQSTVAALQGAPVGSVVVIDEFSALAAEQVARLFARARSAGMSLVLGTQELSDLRLPGRERLLEQVLG
ncbi:MAG TPA: hypothetical protein VGX16_08220, partial [Solirubrobacteraceae bacterium]|nr:hypothetical protein [Solirubrobacteraceae bacterium]